MNPNNPLKQYFRQPSIYIRLPSKGAFYPDGALTMPPNGELPILPMTAIDEITYRTPDALFNGSAVVSVIQSCVPNIHNAWAIPALDIDTILVGIRIASYGPEMEFSSVCPTCGTDHEHVMDLRSVLDKMTAPDYNAPVRAGDLEIHFRPMTYKNLNDNNQAQFEEQKIMQQYASATADNATEDQRLEAMSEALKKITILTIKAMAQSVAVIKSPDTFVNESEYIEDFLQNCDRTLFNRIKEHIISIKEKSELRPFEIVCPEEECKNKYMQAITLDMSNFFEGAS
jgi:hypothetical protein